TIASLSGTGGSSAAWARLACLGRVHAWAVRPADPTRNRPIRDAVRNPSGRNPSREEIVLRRARKMKAAALLLAGSMAMAGCASDEPSSSGKDAGASSSGAESGEALKIGLAYDTGGRGDRSFNDSAY